jgi:hypothetical protein
MGPQDAHNIYVDFGVNRSGIYPDSPSPFAFSHEGTQFIGSLTNGDESRPLSIPFTPFLSPAGDIEITAAKAEIRYGGDMNPANNFSTLSLSILRTAALAKPGAISAASQKVAFEIFNPRKTAVNVRLKTTQPAGVSVSFNVPNINLIPLPTVQNPPLKIMATVNYPQGTRGDIRIEAVGPLPNQSIYGSLTIRLDPTVSVSEHEQVPALFVLHDNFPNPFATETQIDFATLGQGKSVLEIYNLIGQRIKVLENQKLLAGKQTVKWDGTDESGKRVAPGIYFYRLRGEEFVQSKKMVLLY